MVLVECEVVGCTERIRSPILYKGKRICQKCYEEWLVFDDVMEHKNLLKVKK